MRHTHEAPLRILADRNSRRLVRQLRRETTGETTVDRLVDRLHDGESAGVDSPVADRERLTIRLHHVILPKLAAHGVVEYDPVSRVVRYTPDERVEAVLDSLAEGMSVSDI